MLCRCGCGEKLKNEKSKTQTNRGHHHRLQSIKQKKKQTCLKNYGVDNPSQSKIIQKKKEKTWINKYGVNNPNKSKLIKEKRKNTYIQNFGVDHYSKTDEFKHKYKKTSLDRHGVDNIFKDKNTILEIQRKRRITCFKKYGVDNYAKTKKFKELARKNILIQISNQKNNGMPVYPLIGRNEKNFLDKLQEHCKFDIIRQYQVIGYFVDGYIKELNLVIELDEKWHKLLKWYIDRDPIREKDIKSYLNCTFFRVEEDDWMTDSETVIENFKKVILNV